MEASHDKVRSSKVTEHIHGVNTITIADEPFLLAAGDASHLVAEAEDTEAGRPAVEPSRWELVEAWQASYDHSELERPAGASGPCAAETGVAWDWAKGRASFREAHRSMPRTAAHVCELRPPGWNHGPTTSA